MAKKDEQFLSKLLSTFKVEAQEHIKAISTGLLELEKELSSEHRRQIVESIFREVHSLKGAARAVNQTEIETICQSMENVFAACKRGEMTPSAGLFDSLHQTVDVLEKILSSPEAERTAEDKLKIAALIRRLEGGGQGTAVEQGVSTAEPQFPSPGPRPQIPTLGDTVRISTAKLDSLLFQAEEFLSAKLAARQQTADLQEITAAVVDWKKEWAKIRSDMRSIQRTLEKNHGRFGNGQNSRPLTKIFEFLEWNQDFIQSVERKLSARLKSDARDERALVQMVDSLLSDMKKVLMLPFSSLLGVFPKFVRDLSRDQGKDAELVIEGGGIEVDKRILEEIKDPLIHLVRNCIDHGIEKTPDRAKKKKPSRGKIVIAVTQTNSSKIEISVSDDGAGIDLLNVREAAMRVGSISREEEEQLTDQDAVFLIFQSGVSTSPIITDISGRGLGLAIVREKAERLGGMVTVETRKDAGTTFRLVLPITLATFRGILVTAGEQLLVLPATNVERAVRVKKEEIQTVESRETIRLDGRAVALVRLAEVLELPQKKTTADSSEIFHVVVLGSGEKRVGFLVDELFHEEEVLVKSLGKQLSRVRNLSGATILGTGKVAPILNVPDLIKSAVQASGTRAAPSSAPLEEKKGEKQNVLVVEDSITARTLLKNILEAAGYNVMTAVDGVDGFTQLRSGNFDMVVSDVDMPRMNGFDLTAKIRKDKKLAELPVILVTALESREDRERGIDVGANAYIVKSSFDQSNLLEVIRRLI